MTKSSIASQFTLTGAGLLLGVSVSVASIAPSLPVAGRAQDGHYSEAQAKRGGAVYEANCLPCHGASLAGGESGPPLTGGDFVGKWKALSVGDLYDQIQMTMPLDSPGRLSAQQNADVIAFILSNNGQLAGPKDLPSDVVALRKLKLSTPK